MPLLDAPTSAPAAPRHATGWAALLYAGLTLLLGWPALIGRFLVHNISDQYIAGFPFREFAAASLRAGDGFPLWNPYQYGGMPYVAAMHGDIFYPTFLLRLVLPTDVAMTWSFILHLFLAGLLTFVFLRASGFAFFPALTGGAAYMMSGQIASLVSPGHDGKLYLSALLPLFLWSIVRGVRDGRRWAWGLMAIVVGLGVLTPHPQLLQYMLIAGGAYALFLAFDGGDVNADLPAPPRRVAAQRLALALVSIAVGFLIGAIQYAPVLEYVDWSPRAGGAGWEHAISYSMPPEELINTYLPQFSGILDAYWGRNNIHFHSEYVGAAVLLLAGAAFASAGGIRRRALWFWTGTLVVSLLWALGGFTPFYSIVYALVPGTKFFRAPSTIFYITVFAVAVLAAAGTQRALARQLSVRYLGGWLAAGAIVLALAATGALTNVGTSIVGPERFEWIAANQPAVVGGAVRSLAFVLAAAVLLLVYQQGRISAAATGWALAALVGLDLWSVERTYWRFSPPADELYAADPIIEYITRETAQTPGRVLAFPLGPETSERRDPYMARGGQSSGLMHHRIRTVLGYHGNQIGRYDLFFDGGVQLANPNLWQLLNIRYLLTNVPESPFEGARLVAGPVRNAAGSMAYLFEMPGDNRAAWVAPVIVKAEDEAVLATIREPAFDVRSAALFAPDAPVQGVEVTAPPSPLPIQARITRYAPGAIEVQLDQPAPAGSALVVSENYYPGWQARSGDRELAIGRADLSLIGVALAEGVREVTLTFHSEPYELGKTITLVALGLSLAVLVWGLVSERGRRG